MKTNRTHHNRIKALLERQGGIPCVGLRGSVAFSYAGMDWSLPTLANNHSEQDAQAPS